MNRKSLAMALAAAGVAAGGLGFAWPFQQSALALRVPGVVEIQEVKLASKVGGRVKQVFVHEGDLVQSGDELASFEVPELTAQRAQYQGQLQAAEADLEKALNGSRPEERAAAHAAVEAARARWQRLKAGARAEEIRQARGDLESAEADLKVAMSDLERAEQVFPTRGMARAECDKAIASRDRARGQVAASRAHLELLLAGSRPEEIDEAAAQLKQAQANYDLLRAGTRSEEIAAARARVAEARGKVQATDAQLDEASVRAPERAVVEVLAVRKGDVVQPNQAILRVLRADDLWVKVYVPETDLGKVRLNQPAEVRVDAYPGRRFAGTVMQIAAESEFTPRNVQSVNERRHQVFAVKIRVPDPEGVFKSGMAADVVLPLDE
jgi:multidrug resistance efflux pump